jgi:hypothetical protein
MKNYLIRLKAVNNTNKFMIKLFFTIIVFGTIIMISCDKDPNIIGINIQPGQDRIALAETTVPVTSYTLLDDNIGSSQRSLSPIGEIMDPVFGYSKSMVTFQTLLSTSNVDFSGVSNNDIDRLRLSLRYNGHYGDTTGQKTIRIFRIKKDIYRDTAYNSGFRLSESEIELLIETEMIIGQDSMINIDLPLELAYDFISPASADFFIDNESFTSYFKGIYIEADNVQSPGNFIYLDVLNSKSKMQLVYNDTATYDFNITSSSTIINQFEHDHSFGAPEMSLMINDSTNNNEISYLQSLGGLKLKIEFPELINSFDSTQIIGINKARLIINIKQDNDFDLFTPPASLNLVAITPDGMIEFLTDYKVNGSKFGGIYNSGDLQYVFNIPLHIQELLKGSREDLGLYLFPGSNRINANRVIVFGGANPDDELSMKLDILYSIY